jgi:hypothetical protein
MDDTVVIIASKRKPPIKTLQEMPSLLTRTVILLSDPRMVKDHKYWIEDMRRKTNDYENVQIVEGKIGMIPQSAECYRVANKMGFRYFFRLDDDLHRKFFVHMEKDRFPGPLEAMAEARECAEQLGLSLCGFVNTSRRNWMKEGYGRSYGLIHGGSHLCKSAEDPSIFIDENLPAYEDVYRSAAHREVDGAVGRVNFIGLDKRESLRDSSMSKTPEVIAKAKDIILTRFMWTVTCDGERVLDDGNQIIPNWRLVPGPDWVRQ